MSNDHQFKIETPPTIVEVGWSQQLGTFYFRVFRRGEASIAGGTKVGEIPTLRDLVHAVAPFGAIPAALLGILLGEARASNHNGASIGP